MRTRRIVWAAAGILLGGFLAAQALDLQVVVKSTSTVDVPEGIKKLVVSNPEVLDAQPADDGKKVLFTGLQLGVGEVRVMRMSGEDLVLRVSVIRDVTGLADQIKELLQGIEGLVIKTVGGRVVLDGKLLTKSDYDRVKSVEGAYPGVILNLAKMDRAGLDKFVADAIVRDLDLDTVQVKVTGETATLEGYVFDEADMKRAVQKAKLRVPEVVNLLRVEEVMIETDIFFLQIDSSKSSEMGANVLKSLGLEIGGSVSGSSDTKPAYAYSVGASASAKLRALMGSGEAKILAQPHLSTKSGGEGSFHSGGETYFEVAGVNAAKLEKVQYGIIMKVKPTLRGKDRIMNEVTIEVSIPSATTKDAFSLDKFETTSVAMCQVGESVIMSGLAQTLETRFKEKTPLLGSIPILNLFFAESRKGKQERELLVMLTPKPVFPSKQEGSSLGEERRKLAEDQKK
jgi:pilus assembly protein CpaC